MRAAQKREFTGGLEPGHVVHYMGRSEENNFARAEAWLLLCWLHGHVGRRQGWKLREPGEGGGAHHTNAMSPEASPGLAPSLLLSLLVLTAVLRGAMSDELGTHGDSKRESHMPGHTAIRCAPGSLASLTRCTPGFLLRLLDFILQTAEFQEGPARFVQAAERRRQEVERQERLAAKVRTRRPALWCLGSHVSREREKPPDWWG